MREREIQIERKKQRVDAGEGLGGGSVWSRRVFGFPRESESWRNRVFGFFGVFEFLGFLKQSSFWV